MDVTQQVQWLVRHRSAQHIERLRSALGLLRRRLARDPALGMEHERRGALSLRVTSVGLGLPYLVWYSCDEAEASKPVWLLMLRHERQEQARIEGSLPD